MDFTTFILLFLRASHGDIDIVIMVLDEGATVKKCHHVTLSKSCTHMLFMISTSREPPERMKEPLSLSNSFFALPPHLARRRMCEKVNFLQSSWTACSPAFPRSPPSPPLPSPPLRGRWAFGRAKDGSAEEKAEWGADGSAPIGGWQRSGCAPRHLKHKNFAPKVFGDIPP